MPGVSPSDGGYNYYNKAVSELEDEYKQEIKRNKERSEEAQAKAEEGYRTDLRRKEDDLDRTAANIRESANENIAREREYARAEIDRMRGQTYDKFARYQGASADTLKQQLSDSIETGDARHRQDSKALEDTEKSYQRRAEDADKQHGADLERVARVSRDSAMEAYENAIETQRAEAKAGRDEERRKYSELIQRTQDELRENRRRSEDAVSESRRDFEHRNSKLAESNDARFDDAQRTFIRKEEAAAYAVQKSRDDENRQLRDQMKELQDVQGRHAKEKGQARAEVTQETESDNRMERKVLEDTYQREIEKLKRQAKDSDTYFANLNNQTIREKDRYFADLFSKQALETHLDKQQMFKTFGDDREMLTLRGKRDQDYARATLDQQLHDADERKDRALESQGKAFQDTMERSRTRYEDKIKALEQDIQTKATSQDATLISPAAEASVRKSVVGEYEKVLSAEKERSKGTIDSVQQEYASRLQTEVLNAQSKENDFRQQSTAERHAERSQLLQGIQDAEFMKDTTVRNQEIDHQRETENLHRVYSRMLEQQRKQYEEILTSTKNDSLAKLQTARLDSDFEAKMNYRTFSAKQNELIREFEKKLADQKAEYDSVVEELKSDKARTQREAERTKRQDLDEQAKGYEQKLAQLEYQHKERERYITENYSDEIEKVKRSNALLIRKKS